MDIKRIKKKALAYITCNNDLLVFKQPDFPEAGIQVPKGTIDDGETPYETIVREIEEETGLTNCIFKDFLGETYRDMFDFGSDITEHRHFFHFTISPDEKKESWEHFEMHASNKQAPILFSFFWVPNLEGNDILIADQGQLLKNISY